ncbi:MAG TPA: hypothetical protein VNG12_12900 [Acidimicrobiales bacterium]|nr:hypothetical protein [Acidimicrobiales bacterium]
MGALYRLNPVKAVRGQDFITPLHRYVGTQLDARLTPAARKHEISAVVPEA